MIKNPKFDIIALLALIVAILAFLLGDGIIEKLTGKSIKELIAGNSQIVIVYPVCQCEETVETTDTILVRLRWGATTKELAAIAADSVIYRLTLDEHPVDVLQKYQQPPLFVAAEDNPRSSRFGDGWWVYWDVPIGRLTEGNHIIEAEVIVIKAHSDGKDTHEPGSLEPLIMKLYVVKP